MTTENFRNLQDKIAAHNANEESRFAKSLQEHFPLMTRTEALKLAKEIMERRR